MTINEGRPASQRTSVWVIYSEDAVFDPGYELQHGFPRGRSKRITGIAVLFQYFLHHF